jgi:P27 family predicted phage terminase small subunit
MATRGRRAKPTHMKLVEGAEERRINRDEPIPADTGVDLTAPPRGCGAKVAKVWRRLAKDLVDKHVLTEWDTGLFLQYCRLEVHADELSRKIARPATYCPIDGYTGVGSQGQLVQSPYYRQYLQAVAELRALAAHFGLSPSTRAGIVLDNPGAGGKPTMGGERLLS